MVTEERGDEHAFKQTHPDARIGGGSSPEYTPTEGYDFFNSPSYVQAIDADGRPTAMASTNGGNAVTDLRQTEVNSIDIYVGGLSNAAAVAAHLDGRDRSPYYVAAGARMSVFRQALAPQTWILS